jgi:hypothetical protein
VNSAHQVAQTNAEKHTTKLTPIAILVSKPFFIYLYFGI